MSKRNLHRGRGHLPAGFRCTPRKSLPMLTKSFVGWRDSHEGRSTDLGSRGGFRGLHPNETRCGVHVSLVVVASRRCRMCQSPGSVSGTGQKHRSCRIRQPSLERSTIPTYSCLHSPEERDRSSRQVATKGHDADCVNFTAVAAHLVKAWLCRRTSRESATESQKGQVGKHLVR